MGEPAFLIGSQVPQGAQVEWFVGAGGLRLRAALFPAPDAWGSVILSPGRAEPIEKYFEVVEELRARQLSVLVHDWRGHGLSGRLHRDAIRGHAHGLRPFVEDYARLVEAFGPRLPRPWIGLGHSMGGGLTALMVLEGKVRLDAAVLTSPMLGIQFGKAPAGLARSLARGLSRLGGGGAYAAGPGDPLGGAFETNILTHDRVRWERFVDLLRGSPELQIGGVTWAWLDFAFELFLRLSTADVSRLGTPITIVAAGEEKLIDNAATQAFAERTPGVRYVEIEGAFHEILMETDPIRDRFWAEFDAAVAPLVSASGAP
jgi:lysophospholipase